jgi:NADH-quinone oxidoreductase subunit A
MSFVPTGSAAGYASAMERLPAEMSRPWLVVLSLTLGGVLFFVVAIAANRMLRAEMPRAEKLTTYESGVDPVGQGWAQTQVRYYLYAYLYVLFAVDAVYLFPWATVVDHLGWATVAEMAFFLGVLALGLVHAARRGALHWTVESAVTRRGRR